MIGEKLRELRHGRHLSLTDVAGKARISAATLSRIENEKQALDVDMLFALARILRVTPEELVGGDGRDPRPDDEQRLAERITAMPAAERTRLWRDLAASGRTARSRRGDVRDVSSRIEELLAQVDFLRQEIEAVRTRLRKR